MRNNAAPTASFTVSCTLPRAARFDATASGDSDGTVTSYAWDFGDGQTDTTSGADGDPHLRRRRSRTSSTLTRDRQRRRHRQRTTRVVSPVAVRPIALVGSTVNQGNVATPNTTVPAGTAAGDRLVMVLSLNDTTRTVGTTHAG